MASHFFKRCSPPRNDSPTRVTGAHEADKRSRITRLLGAWRGQEGLSFEMVIGGCTCPVSTNRAYFHPKIFGVHINALRLSRF